MTERTCPHCGDPVPEKEPGTVGRKRRFCSPACTKSNRRAPRDCVMCGISFVRWEDWKHPGAAAVRCHPCYLEYTRRRQRVGDPALPLSDYEYIRRTLERLPFDQALQSMRSCKRIQNLRAQVVAEETHCHICGDEVDRTLPGTHVDGPTIDHLIPVSTPRGLWHIFNRELVRLAHRRCNSAEGDRIQRRMERERVALVMASRWLGAELKP